MPEFVSMGLEKAMGSVPIGFLPSQVAGLELWTRFNRGITEAGAGVSQWDDQSGNGNHLKQGTDTNRPSKEADGSILFDGADNYLATDAFAELTQPNTIYILFKQVTWADTANIYDGISATKRNLLAQLGTTPKMAIYAGANNLTMIPNLALSLYGVISSIYNSTSSSVQLNNETPTTGASTGSDGLTGLTLGSKYDASQFANVQVKEVIIYSGSHDADTRTKVIKYLADVGDLSI